MFIATIPRITNMKVSSITSTSATIRWNPISAKAKLSVSNIYITWRSLPSGSDKYEYLDKSMVEFGINTLTPNQKYEFKMSCIGNNNVNGQFSDLLVFTTKHSSK